MSPQTYSWYFAASGLAVALISAVHMAYGSVGMAVMPLVAGFRVEFLGVAYLLVGLGVCTALLTSFQWLAAFEGANSTHS